MQLIFRGPFANNFKYISNFIKPCIPLSKSVHTSTKKKSTDVNHQEDIKQLKASLKKLVDVKINPFVDKWEAEGQFPAHQVFKQLGDAGFLGITRPTAYGGLGLDYRYTMAAAEALGTIRCGGIPTAIAVQTDMATPALARFGSEELKQEFLVPSIAGDVVSCIGVSEPDAGSDVASITTRAKISGDDLIINGQKMWITNGHQADWCCLLANTSEGAFHSNKSLICVPMKTKGITLGKPIKKLGFKSSDTAIITFEDVRIPAKNIIGEAGKGFMYQMLQFQEERLIACALSVPSMDMMIDETIEYTRQRKIFGQPVLNNQVVHYRMAELKTEVEALRALMHKAADKLAEGEDVTLLASMAKLKTGRLVREVADSCLQYWGGMGYTEEVLVSRLYRDMRVVSIGGGADEVMLAIICKYMGTLPLPPKKIKK